MSDRILMSPRIKKRNELMLISFKRDFIIQKASLKKTIIKIIKIENKLSQDALKPIDIDNFFNEATPEIVESFFEKLKQYQTQEKYFLTELINTTIDEIKESNSNNEKDLLLTLK